MKTILGVKLYTMEETADLLGVTKPTISNYLADGRIAFRRIGCRKYISEEDLKDFLLTPQKVSGENLPKQ